MPWARGSVASTVPPATTMSAAISPKNPFASRTLAFSDWRSPDTSPSA